MQQFSPIYFPANLRGRKSMSFVLLLMNIPKTQNIKNILNYANEKFLLSIQ